jgi:hypothetical protein
MEIENRNKLKYYLINLLRFQFSQKYLIELSNARLKLPNMGDVIYISVYQYNK